MATLNGTPGQNPDVGTPLADAMGLVANDSLEGLNGNDSLDGGISNDTINGRAGNDTLNGNAGNDTVNGGTGNDYLFGSYNAGNDRDTLIGGRGRDIFFLGNANDSFYDDRQPATAGINNYALITDFNPNEDRIELNGRRSDYILAPSPANLPTGTEIYRRQAQGGQNELIAIAQGSLNLNLNSNYFQMTNAEINLAQLNGKNGFAIKGVAANDESGLSVSTGGDINRDGLDDLLIGSFGQIEDYSFGDGNSYLVFGKPGFSPNVNLSQLNGNNGFVIEDAGGSFGVTVSHAGDINGDGFDDILIGANGGEYKGVVSGNQSYVIFGSSQKFGDRFNSKLNGSNGFTLNLTPATPYDYSNIAVSSAGDFNGDGFDDLVIGAGDFDINNKRNAGATYVVFGDSRTFPSNLNSSQINGTNGIVINGINENERLGTAVGTAGDVNGDGIDDIIIGSNQKSYVVFGTSGRSNVDLTTLNGKNGFAIATPATSVSTAGDTNNDGLDDIIIGTNGKSYVVFGTQGSNANLNPTNLNGSNGFTITGIGSLAVSNAGDFNGDGEDDLLIGARQVDVNGKTIAGESYVVFGTGNFNAKLNLSELNGNKGIVIPGVNAYDRLGNSVSTAGDINGDGFDDIIIGAPGANRQESVYGQGPTGISYVVFGRNSGKVTNAGTPGNDRLTGTASNDILIDGRGNDTVVGTKGSDVLYGGAGNDIIDFDAMDRRVNGGSGTDSLRLTGSGINLDLTTSDHKLSEFEIVDLTGSGNNSLKLNRLDVLNLSDTTNQLIVTGNAGDVVSSLGQGWSKKDLTTIDGFNYERYIAGAASLLIDPNINHTIT